MLTNASIWAVLGGGIEIRAGEGGLTARALSPNPALRRGVPLRPDDPDDPLVFRLPLDCLGAGETRAAFEADHEGRVVALHFDQAIPSLRRRPRIRSPHYWLRLAVSAVGLGTMFWLARKRLSVSQRAFRAASRG